MIAISNDTMRVMSEAIRRQQNAIALEMETVCKMNIQLNLERQFSYLVHNVMIGYSPQPVTNARYQKIELGSLDKF